MNRLLTAGCRVLLTVLTALALASCGVPQDAAPRALDRGNAPFGVFDSEAAPAPQGELAAELWFLRNRQPVPVPREVEQPGSPRQVLGQLLAGPTETELADGLSTAIPTTLQLVELSLEEGTAVVTLTGLTEQVQVEAYAQIVATLDARPGVSGVRFRDAVGDVPVPRGDGGLSSGAVTRSDYDVLLGLAAANDRVQRPLDPAPAPTPSG